MTSTDTQSDLPQEVLAVGAGCAVILQAVAVSSTWAHALSTFLILLAETGL